MFKSRRDTDMDWDQLATLAQLVTGVATLAVAVLLVSQLRQQHRDAEREILYTSQGRMQDLMRTVMNSDFGPIWTKGGEDFDSLNPVEKEQYRAWCYSIMTLQSVNAQSGHEGLDRGVASGSRHKLLEAGNHGLGWVFTMSNSVEVIPIT